MSRMSISTPCPAPPALSSLPLPANRRTSGISVDAPQDDTAEIEYTRALNLDFKHAKPRRKSTFQQRRAEKQPAITIFEDVLEEQELVLEPRREIGGSTLLARPAQKPMLRGLHSSRDGGLKQEQPKLGSLKRRSSSIVPQQAINEARPHEASNLETIKFAEEMKHRAGLKKEPRRRTIFVPADDTTMLTIHPGAQTTDRLNDTFQLPGLQGTSLLLPEKTHILSTASIAKAPKRPRMSMIGAVNRLPLQPSTDLNLYNLQGDDAAGQDTGKENLPPGHHSANHYQESKLDFTTPEKHKIARSSVFQQTAASKARQSIAPREALPIPNASSTMTVQKTFSAPRRQSLRPDSNVVRTQSKRQRVSFYPGSDQVKQTAPDYDETPCETSRQSTDRPPRPLARKVARLSQYPVLSEDLAQPELYEDSWLSHQEIALTEVVNQLFRDAEPAPDAWNREKSLRQRLLSLYHREDVTMLHRRLQASLLYGALSRPAGAPSPPNPSYDIGLRKRFLSLWLDSYNHRILRAAAEVVFGRELPKRLSASNHDPHSTLDPHKGRRSLVAFLETFLVEVEDVEEPKVDRGDDPNPRWRKTVLRSLMLIRLLDTVLKPQMSSGCLFKPTSTRKSSVAILQTLTTLLIPSTGDIVRTLRHLDYEVHHIQDPLDEVHYKIDNIATDLRDGVLLTRLVELLLFSRKQLATKEASGDATVTIRLPDLTVLESALNDNDGSRCPRVLSQHLKMPCLGRAQKVFNVDIALSALRGHSRLDDDASETTADDIVNGHRERTLSLLWSLVSTHGLEKLVNFNALASEVRKMCGNMVELPSDLYALSDMQQESLLKKWASAHCIGKGVRIGNLTTSFADGKAYAAILENFMGYVTSGFQDTKEHSVGPAEVRTRLHSFGCSEAFIKQLAAGTGTIPSRKTTVSNLAFLASRLLPLARRHNVAVVIQRAWRSRRAKAMATQRIALMRLAHDCAKVVQTQQRVTAAAVVLQKAWRRLIDRRVSGLNNDVERIQCIARGWLARRRLHKQRGQPWRVMGGW